MALSIGCKASNHMLRNMVLRSGAFGAARCTSAVAVAGRVTGVRGFVCSRSLQSSATSATSTAATEDPDAALDAEIKRHAGRSQTPVSLRALLQTASGEKLDEFEKYLGKHRVRSGDGNGDAPELTNAQRVVMQVASFMHRELPIRFAHRAVELRATSQLCNARHVQRIRDMYKQSFKDIMDLPAPTSPEKEAAFAECCRNIFERHASMLINMAKGAYEIRMQLLAEHNRIKGTPDNTRLDLFADQNVDIQRRLNDFYFSRIGIRLLISQYLALRESAFGEGGGVAGQGQVPEATKPRASEVPSEIATGLPRSHLVGLIDLHMSPREVISRAVEAASYLCTRTHGDAPEVKLFGRVDLTFPYIASHLEYIIVELLKNSMRATVEKHGVDDMPPIKIVIADGEENEEVVIKVSDEGGGIKRSSMDKIWSYLYTTGDRTVLQNMLDTTTDFSLRGNSSSSNNIPMAPVADAGAGADAVAPEGGGGAAPLAGLGYGLPIARNYARFFGGDLHLMSMEGYGTDSFIYLPRLKLDTGEQYLGGDGGGVAGDGKGVQRHGVGGRSRI